MKEFRYSAKKWLPNIYLTHWMYFNECVQNGFVSYSIFCTYCNFAPINSLLDIITQDNPIWNVLQIIRKFITNVANCDKNWMCFHYDNDNIKCYYVTCTYTVFINDPLYVYPQEFSILRWGLWLSRAMVDWMMKRTKDSHLNKFGFLIQVQF